VQGKGVVQGHGHGGVQGQGVVQGHGHGGVQSAGDKDWASSRWPFVLAGGIFVRFARRSIANRHPQSQS
jgi:hypothetical protein